MPVRNEFRHQLYPTKPDVPPVFRSLTPLELADGSLSVLHSRHKVGRVVLVHGTFAGDDPIGISEILGSMADGAPFFSDTLRAMAERLRTQTPAIVGSAMKDMGNYTEEFRDLFQRLTGDDPQVELVSPRWTSQNHHLARADLAVQLIHQLLQRPLAAGQRLLLWGHSHAGNAFALMTNLLANQPVSVARFFEAAGPQAGPHWAAVQEALKHSPAPHPLARTIDYVNFGTPVRYGWDPEGCGRLIHVLFHRSWPPENPERTKPLYPPLSPSDLLSARFGDWVQAFAIAGTDVSTPATRAANERLSALLENNLPEPEHQMDTRFLMPKRLRDACARWKHGTRCHTDGLNLLVDYQPTGLKTRLGAPIEHSLLGHGVATTVAWLPAHLSLVADSLGELPLPS